jgi:hypothetical protein
LRPSSSRSAARRRSGSPRTTTIGGATSTIDIDIVGGERAYPRQIEPDQESSRPKVETSRLRA